jgi:CDP-glycerol glycerophosphotransferase (TagB/SpsB family)
LDYQELSDRHENLVIDSPSVSSEILSCDVPTADYRRLAGLIAHCDVLVNAFSTTTLEAFLLDKPVVLISDEAHRAAGLSDLSPESRPFHLDTHMQSSFGAAKVARSFPELVEHVRAYLEDPSIDAPARRQLAEAECGPIDGRRAEHIGRYLLAQLATNGKGSGAPLRAPVRSPTEERYPVLQDGARQETLS